MTDNTAAPVSPEKGHVHPVIRLLLVATITALALVAILSIEFSHSARISTRLQPGAVAEWSSSPVALSVRVGSSGNLTPSGTVTFTLSSTGAVLCRARAPFSTNWYACAVNITKIPVGGNDITIHFSGDTRLAPSSTHTSVGILRR